MRAIRKGKYKYIRNYQPFNIDALFNFYRYKMLAYKEWESLYKSGQLNEAQQQFFQPRTAEALYDIEKDPYEVNNLAANPTHQIILKELRGMVQQQVKGMPDLSFYPEPYFLENGLANPVQFGQQQKAEIAALVDVADLSLLPYKKAKKGIKKALKSYNPWQRYWGLIVCSSFGKQANKFYKKAQKISQKEKEGIVKMRAIEFLALNQRTVDKQEIINLLKNAKSKTEANLLLNSVALIKTMQPDFSIDIPKSMFPKEWVAKPSDLVNRRADFINEGK